MTVRCRTGAVGVVALGAAAVVFLTAAAVCVSFGERLMVPLGLTRPVPCTRPPVRWRMVPPLVRVMRACGASVFASKHSKYGYYICARRPYRELTHGWLVKEVAQV